MHVLLPSHTRPLKKDVGSHEFSAPFSRCSIQTERGTGQEEPEDQHLRWLGLFRNARADAELHYAIRVDNESNPSADWLAPPRAQFYHGSGACCSSRPF